MSVHMHRQSNSAAEVSIEQASLHSLDKTGTDSSIGNASYICWSRPEVSGQQLLTGKAEALSQNAAKNKVATTYNPARNCAEETNLAFRLTCWKESAGMF